MVSKMHILGLPGATKFNVYISGRAHEDYQRVSIGQTAKHNQNLRIIDLGNVPGRYLMIEVTHGEPLPNDEECVEVYGMRSSQMERHLGTGETEMLLDKAFQIIYGFN